MNFPQPLVSVDWLVSHLDQPEVRIVDCRFGAGTDRDAGRHAYASSHIPVAVYFDLDRDLAGPQQAHGGRHPLPDPAVIAAKLGAAGIGPGVKVVVYDESGQHAARCWWLLRWLGHNDVAVLDGGWRAWVAAGGPVTAESSRPEPVVFTPRPQVQMVAEMEDVRHRPDGHAVIDARSPARFAGEPDPLDEKYGHIPGAINRFWQEGLSPDGRWRTPEEQRRRFAGLPAPEAIICSCGSGVTACANLLAMEIAGLSGARLYVGSWSDWCSYEENPVER